MDGFKNVEKVGEIEPHLTAKDTKRTERTLADRVLISTDPFRLWHRRERTAPYKTLKDLQEADDL
jgi:hypothetical protein